MVNIGQKLLSGQRGIVVSEESAVNATGSLRATIVSSVGGLSPTEVRVATFLLGDGSNHEDFSLSELAHKSGVSEAAVVRTCKALGFQGFRGFRLAWVREAGRRQDFREADSVLFSDLFKTLHDTEVLLVEGLAPAAEAIARAERVFLYGSGASALIAEVSAKSFTVAGHFAIAFRDDSSGLQALRHLGPSSVVVIVSHRGENDALAEILGESKERGAVRIVLTSEPRSTLATMADIVLLTAGAVDSANSSPVGSHARVVQLAAVHALITEVSFRLKKGLPAT